MKTIPVKRELDAFANGSLQQIQATDRMHALLVTRADALMGCTEGSRQQTFVTSEHPRVSVRYLIDPRSTEEVCHARYIQGWSDRTIAVADVLRSGGRYAGGRWHRRRSGSHGCRTARGRSRWSARCRGRRPEHHYGAPSLPQMLARSQWRPSLRAALRHAARQANERKAAKIQPRSIRRPGFAQSTLARSQEEGRRRWQRRHIDERPMVPPLASGHWPRGCEEGLQESRAPVKKLFSK